MHHNTINTVGKIFLLNVGGWALSLEQAESVVRMLCFVIPAVISVFVYINNRKKNKKEIELLNAQIEKQEKENNHEK